MNTGNKICSGDYDYLKFGLFGTRYVCKGLTKYGDQDVFLLPRFDGAILNAENEPIEGQRNKLIKFVVGIKEGETFKEKVITVEKNNTEECFFDIEANGWKSCY